MSDDLGALERSLFGRQKGFKNRQLLERALVHRSYLNEATEPGIESNERLEFLGDAVLGLVVASKLFLLYPGVPEGRLTEMRSHLVKGESLALVAERLGLGAYLRLGRGENATGGRQRPMNLARALEAVIGAVFIDKGFRTTERWLLRLLETEFAGLGGGPAEDAKSRLQHAAQSIYGTTPRYRIVSAEGPDHAKLFTVEVVVRERSLGGGRGRSKRAAEKEAAQAALRTIALEHPDIPVMSNE